MRPFHTDSAQLTARLGVASLLDSILDVDIDLSHEENKDLVDTPDRVVRSFIEMTRGYSMKPEEILKAQFSQKNYDQVVVVKDIPFWSTCLHHLLPFYGKASIAYLPQGKVVGLSKLPRLVEAFSRRLQIQEQMTQQIADAIVTHLECACMVVVRGHHTCMQMRGIRSSGEMVTSALKGVFHTDASLRTETMKLLEPS